MTLSRALLFALPLLIAADTVPRPAASRVTLDGRAMPLSAAAAELSRQANIAIDVSRAEGDRIVRLPLSDVPFWNAVEQLARAADHRLAVSSQGSRVVLSRETYRAAPVSLHGPFRFAARRVNGRIDLDTGAVQHEVLVELAWEPRFRAYFYELDPRSLSASDGAGRALAVVPDGAGLVPIGAGSPELAIKLRGVPRTADKIGRLEGTIKFLGTSQMLQFSFPLATTPAQQVRGEVTGTLVSLRKNVRLWTAEVELQYPDDMPKFESFQSFLVENEAWLQRGDGTKFPVKRFELGAQTGKKLPITYYIIENDKDGPALGDLKEWRLVVRVPGRIIEETVPLRLTDIPLR